MEQLKKWWLVVVGFAVVILDFGFDAINPLLEQAKLGEHLINGIKIVFGLYGIYKLNQQPAAKLIGEPKPPKRPSNG